MIVTIDGPSASGKGVTARRLAQELGCFYLNTGLLYRAIGYLLVNKFNYTHEQLGAPSAADVQKCADDILYTYTTGEREKIIVDDVDITQQLKDQAVDTYASVVSTNSAVREAVVTIEREVAQKHNVVVDGRDSGSAVFPQAEHKFFLTASLEVRAQRWQKEQLAQGKEFSLEEVRVAIAERDERDSERVLAPLVIPTGAEKIDNSELTIEQTVVAILEKIHK